MSHTTAHTGCQTTITLEDLKRAMREIDLLPRPTEWVLVSPDGKVWKAEPWDLLKVLMPYHPLFKQLEVYGI